MLRNCVCLATLAVLLASPAIASEWVKIGEGKDGRLWFVDKASIIREGDVVRAWGRVELTQPNPYPPTGEIVSVATFLEVIDCSKAIIGVKASKLFAANEYVIAENEYPDDMIQWQSAASSSFLAGVVSFVCSPDTDPEPR